MLCVNVALTIAFIISRQCSPLWDLVHSTWRKIVSMLRVFGLHLCFHLAEKCFFFCVSEYPEKKC